MAGISTYYGSRIHTVKLWSSEGASAGGMTDCVETHGGENNGGAQRRLCPRTGKFATLPGLSWMNDVRNFGTFWSQNPQDPDVGGSVAGIVVPFDNITGGPDTRMQHVLILDCEGFDKLTLHWLAKMVTPTPSAVQEGLAISGVADPTDSGFADRVFVMAAGMPCIDSSDPMFSIPKLMRLNENDSLASEGALTATANDATTNHGPGEGNPRTVPYVWSPPTLVQQNFDPETWIQGGGLLWSVGRSKVYPGTDRWWMYDQVKPTAGWGVQQNPFTTYSGQGDGTATGFIQCGRAYNQGGTLRSKQMRGGDKYECIVQLGYPVSAGLLTAQGFNNTLHRPFPADALRISGIARIALAFGGIGVSWGAGGSDNTFLVSTPVGPAVAPRQFIRGRLFAKLERL